MRHYLIFIFIITQFLCPVHSLKAESGEEHVGIIQEMLESGGYSYFRVIEDGEPYWIAVRNMPAIPGATIAFTEQMWMPDFTSKTLHMTFPTIMFAGNARLMRSQTGLTDRTAEQSFAEPPPGSISVAELKKNYAMWDGKDVTVSGRVEKVRLKIMGKTWIHIFDPLEPDSGSVVITTLDSNVSSDMSIVAQGILNLDRDFGYGYIYDLIIEDATVTEY